jgi:hypothetical protein
MRRAADEIEHASRVVSFAHLVIGPIETDPSIAMDQSERSRKRARLGPKDNHNRVKRDAVSLLIFSGDLHSVRVLRTRMSTGLNQARSRTAMTFIRPFRTSASWLLKRSVV